MESKYITRYKKTLSEEIEEAYGVPAYLPDKLERLRNKLIYSLRKDFEKNPGSIGPYNLLKKALRECLILQERSVKASKFYINAPEKRREDVLAVFYSLDDAVGYLIELLLDNWQEAEKPEKYLFPIEWNVAKPLMQLVRENARFTVHYQSMQHRLNAAKINAPQPAAKVADGTIPSDAVATASTKRMNSRELKIAKISSGVELHEIRELLSEAGLGRIYTKPGEWTAALRALYVAGILKGTAPEVTRWAVEQGYFDLSTKETIKKAWSGECNEAEQFSNTDQRTVFRTTLTAANKLLNEKGLNDKNK